MAFIGPFGLRTMSEPAFGVTVPSLGSGAGTPFVVGLDTIGVYWAAVFSWAGADALPPLWVAAAAVF